MPSRRRARRFFRAIAHAQDKGGGAAEPERADLRTE
jgi:hypothetical protein